jgi:putative glutamine amidotransferase
MAKPVIGVTPNFFDADRAGAPHPEGSYYLNHPYVAAVVAAGGIPVSLPYLDPGEDVDTLLDRLDGLVLTGGFDIDMRHFGEDLHPTVKRVHPHRLAFELDLCRKAVARDLPVLAICLGMQTLNLAFEGSFVQHLPDRYGEQVGHKQPEAERDRFAHGVDLAEGSLARRVLGDSHVRVNSMHHQAIGEAGEGLVITGRAEDGVAEVLERPASRFCLGVQWHPEDLQDHAPQRRLFESLLAAAREARA